MEKVEEADINNVKEVAEKLKKEATNSSENVSKLNQSVQGTKNSTSNRGNSKNVSILTKKRSRQEVSIASGVSSASGVSGTTINILPPIDQIRAQASKVVNDCPPFVHLSSKDCASQLKIEDGPKGRRLTLRGCRGYRMARASHGVSYGNYFYEALILQPPTAREIVDSLPSNARLSATLQKKLEDQLEYEAKQLECGNDVQPDTKLYTQSSKATKRCKEDRRPQFLTGHLRLGWSMRTGELQAPVGYDKWSYAIGDIMGSRIHNSLREDRWGGVPFYPGDVVGIAISLLDPAQDDLSSTKKKTKLNASNATPATNQIRFFLNGEAMGHFVVSRTMRSGGDAFDNVRPGTYYPATSAYMGGAATVNFGPYFTYPIHASQLPSGMKLKPISELCLPPLSPDEVLTNALKEKAFPKKTDPAVLSVFKEAVLAEAKIRYDVYENHLQKHIQEVRESRMKRHLSTNGLPTSTENRLNEEEQKEMDIDVQKNTEQGKTNIHESAPVSEDL